MNSTRSNFNITVVSNQVYVFGGLAGPSSGKTPWRPTLSTTVCERYSPSTEKWSDIIIQNLPNLAATSWTSTDDGRIFILGGSDGNLLTNELFEVTITKDSQTAKRLNTDFEFSTGMGHLVYRKEANEIHHIGGFGSEAINYSLTLSNQSKGWQASKSQFVYVMSEKDDELTQWPSVFFA